MSNVVKYRMDRIRDLLSKPLPGPSKQWAHDLLARQAEGVRLSPIQEQLAREAIATRVGGIFNEE